jgi:tRNA A37 threonylcarbamoyladenosine dehydratase
VLIDHEVCRRTRDSITWPTDAIEDALNRAEELALSVVKVHSHPQGYPRFSEVDDAGDNELLPAVRSWVERDVPHGSTVMLPDGQMFGRYLWHGAMTPLDLISVAGPTMQFWWHGQDKGEIEFGAAQDQAFGDGTTQRMGRLRIGVVGGSGTGSPTIEQLLRLGAGEIVVVEPDHVEMRNLNRILHTTVTDAERKRPKADVIEEAVARTGLPTRVIKIANTLMSPEGVRAIASCDVLFGCVDTHSARFVMNLLATHYIIPYFDVGVMLDAQGDGPAKGRIKDIFGTVHYLIPGRSSLVSREAISLAMVASEGLHEKDPAAAAQQVKEKYIRGLAVNRPAVISVNFFASSLAVNDFLARLHPYRRIPNSDIASIEFSLGGLRLTPDEETERCEILAPYVGWGDRDPLLGLPELKGKG